MALYNQKGDYISGSGTPIKRGSKIDLALVRRTQNARAAAAGTTTSYVTPVAKNAQGMALGATAQMSPGVTLDGTTTSSISKATGSFTGDSADFLKSLFQARPQFVGQQNDLLKQFGPSIRNSIFAASPELAMAGQHISDTFSDPFGGARSTLEDAMRSAQGARGFGGGGSGVAGEEARYLTNFAMQRQDKMLPVAMQFGQQMLTTAGLDKPYSPSLGEVGGLAMQSRTLNEQVIAGEAQSKTAAQMYEDYMKSLNQPQSIANGNTNPYAWMGAGAGGGTTSVIVGSGGAGGGTQGGAGQFSGQNTGTQGGAGQFTAAKNPYYTW